MGDRGSIESCVHAESAVVEVDDADWQVLVTWIERHARLTGSEQAAAWLRRWRDGGVEVMRESMFAVLPASVLAAERRPAMREPVPA
jgi:glutamate synthase domain-containing protein 3